MAAALEGVAKPGRWAGWRCLGVELVRSSLDQLWDFTIVPGGPISPPPLGERKENIILCKAVEWSELVSGWSTTDLFLKIFGAFLTLKVWWISSTYNV